MASAEHQLLPPLSICALCDAGFTEGGSPSPRSVLCVSEAADSHGGAPRQPPALLAAAQAALGARSEGEAAPVQLSGASVLALDTSVSAVRRFHFDMVTDLHAVGGSNGGSASGDEDQRLADAAGGSLLSAVGLGAASLLVVGGNTPTKLLPVLGGGRDVGLLRRVAGSLLGTVLPSSSAIVFGGGPAGSPSAPTFSLAFSWIAIHAAQRQEDEWMSDVLATVREDQEQQHHRGGSGAVSGGGGGRSSALPPLKRTPQLALREPQAARLPPALGGASLPRGVQVAHAAEVSVTDGLQLARVIERCRQVRGPCPAPTNLFHNLFTLTVERSRGASAPGSGRSPSSTTREGSFSVLVLADTHQAVAPPPAPSAPSPTLQAAMQAEEEFAESNAAVAVAAVAAAAAAAAVGVAAAPTMPARLGVQSSRPAPWIRPVESVLQLVEQRVASPPFSRSKVLMLMRDLLLGRQSGGSTDGMVFANAALVTVLDPSLAALDLSVQSLQFNERIVRLLHSLFGLPPPPSSDLAAKTNGAPPGTSTSAGANAKFRPTTSFGADDFLRDTATSAPSLQPPPPQHPPSPQSSQRSQQRSQQQHEAALRADELTTDAVAGDGAWQLAAASRRGAHLDDSSSSAPQPAIDLEASRMEVLHLRDALASTQQALEALRVQSGDKARRLRDVTEQLKRLEDGASQRVNEELAQMREQHSRGAAVATERQNKLRQQLRDFELYKEVMDNTVVRMRAEMQDLVTARDRMQEQLERHEKAAQKWKQAAQKSKSDAAILSSELRELRDLAQRQLDEESDLRRAATAALRERAAVDATCVSVQTEAARLRAELAAARQNEAAASARADALVASQQRLADEARGRIASLEQQLQEIRGAHLTTLELLAIAQERAARPWPAPAPAPAPTPAPIPAPPPAFPEGAEGSGSEDDPQEPLKLAAVSSKARASAASFAAPTPRFMQPATQAPPQLRPAPGFSLREQLVRGSRR